MSSAGVSGRRAGAALVCANARYWPTVAPRVRGELSRWHGRARAIPDAGLRAAALAKLEGERFNVQGAATLATTAPRGRRAGVVRAIVALQTLYDYLDLLTEEQPEQLQPNRRLYDALLDAIAPGEPVGGGYYGDDSQTPDGGYLEDLVGTVRTELARLPAWGALASTAMRAGRRCVDAQVLGHAAARADTGELERWARRNAEGTGLGWPELIAGSAASVLALHALIAAAARPETTRADGERIDAAYLAIGALTMLDSLVDGEQDRATGQWSYARWYDGPGQMGERLAGAARTAAMRARAAPNGAHHEMTLVGVVAYYASAVGPDDAYARAVVKVVRAELGGLLGPTLALMRAWRAAKRAGERARRRRVRANGALL